MSAYIIPLFILVVIVAGFFRRGPVYGSFVTGVKGRLDLLLSIMPYFTVILIAVELFTASGLGAKLERLLEPVFTALGIPSELAQLVIIRPLSGNGSIAMLQTLMNEYGADSYIARCACVCYGSSETVFYISAVYFAGMKAKGLMKPIVISLFSALVATVLACALCKIM